MPDNMDKAREVARASRYGGLNNETLSELLPELPEGERRVLGENIEKAIQDEVERSLDGLDWEGE